MSAPNDPTDEGSPDPREQSAYGQGGYGYADPQYGYGYEQPSDYLPSDHPSNSGQYDQSQYDQPRHDQPQYGQPGYGYQQPAYPAQPTYPYAGAQPPYGPGGPPATPGSSSGGSKRGWVIGAAAVVVVVVIAVVAYSLTGGKGGGGNATANAAAQKWISALNDKDTGALSSLQCQADRGRADSSGAANPTASLPSSVTDVSYSLNSVQATSDTRATAAYTVKATFAGTQRSVPSTFPLVKESGKWFVCYSLLGSGTTPSIPGTDGSSTTASDTGTPTPTPTDTSTTTGTPTSASTNFDLGCFLDSSGAFAALTFVSALSTGNSDTAVACSLNGKLPANSSLITDGSDWMLDPTSFGSDAPTFTSGAGLKIRVTTVAVGENYRVSKIDKI